MDIQAAVQELKMLKQELSTVGWPGIPALELRVETALSHLLEAPKVTDAEAKPKAGKKGSKGQDE